MNANVLHRWVTEHERYGHHILSDADRQEQGPNHTHGFRASVRHTVPTRTAEPKPATRWQRDHPSGTQAWRHDSVHILAGECRSAVC